MNTQNEALLIGKTEKGATAQKIGETAVNNPKTAIELKIVKLIQFFLRLLGFLV